MFKIHDLKKANIEMLKVAEKSAPEYTFCSEVMAFDSEEYLFLPGFCDVHVHFREPGFSYKETIKSGSKSASRGGYTAVCTMPNLSPAPDSEETLAIQQEIIDRDSVIAVYPYATITKKRAGSELVDFASLKGAIAFSDDGSGIQSASLMEEAMKRAKDCGKMIVAHCEVNDLLFGGYIHDGQYAKAHGHRGICSESEYAQIARDIELAKKTGVKYHVCHISAKESVALIREAKRDGVDITCETAPHYLTMDDSFLIEDGRMKMNPPLRSREDREALVEGVIDGTIDMIATDHAPHSAEEKSRGLKASAFGVVGLETAFPALYTHLVKEGVIDLKKLIRLLVFAPRERFNIRFTNDYSVWKMDEFTVEPEQFLSKGRATPYQGERLIGVNQLTVYNGEIVYRKQ